VNRIVRRRFRQGLLLTETQARPDGRHPLRAAAGFHNALAFCNPLGRIVADSLICPVCRRLRYGLRGSVGVAERQATRFPQADFWPRASASADSAFIRPISARSVPQVEVMFGGPPMALLSHQERPNASLRANPPPIVSKRGVTVPRVMQFRTKPDDR
jgi:hypothetical protein